MFLEGSFVCLSKKGSMISVQKLIISELGDLIILLPSNSLNVKEVLCVCDVK